MKSMNPEKEGNDLTSTLLSSLDLTPIGHLVLDGEFNVIFWNQCLELWTGIDRKTIVDTSLFSHFAYFEGPRYFHRIAGVLDGGPPVVFSSQLHKHLIPSPLPDGSLRIQQTTVTKILDPSTSTFLALFSIQDVTNLTNALETNRAALRRVEAEIVERKQTEQHLKRTVSDLRAAMEEVEALRGIIPICASCKRIRDDKGYWTQLESYFHQHSIAEFSHGICPECIEKLYPDLADDVTRDAAARCRCQGSDPTLRALTQDREHELRARFDETFDNDLS